MIATSFTRIGCTLGKRIISYTSLKQHYVCNECGGQIVVGFDDTGDWAKCSGCSGQDFISARQFDQECVEAWEVERGLPPELRALVGDSEPMVSAQQAINELFGKD